MLFYIFWLCFIFYTHTHTHTKYICFQVKEQVQADVVIASAAQDERLLKILHGQGTCTVMHIFYLLFIIYNSFDIFVEC